MPPRLGPGFVPKRPACSRRVSVVLELAGVPGCRAVTGPRDPPLLLHLAGPCFFCSFLQRHPPLPASLCRCLRIPSQVERPVAPHSQTPCLSAAAPNPHPCPTWLAPVPSWTGCWPLIHLCRPLSPCVPCFCAPTISSLRSLTRLWPLCPCRSCLACCRSVRRPGERAAMEFSIVLELALITRHSSLPALLSPCKLKLSSQVLDPMHLP